jgi:hypothetical protein
MRTRLLFATAAVAVTLVLTACSESSTAPRLKPSNAAKDEELTCRTGYHPATREDGSQSCEEDSEGMNGFVGSVPELP